MNELITVIVPVFNNEKYIKKCLDSICSSEYEQLEIIVVDDGSTDDSGGICDACSEKDSRIKVLHQKIPVFREAGIMESGMHQENISRLLTVMIMWKKITF